MLDILTNRRRLTAAAVAAGIAATAMVVLPQADAQAASTTHTVTAAADTYTRADAPTTNFGTEARVSTQGDVDRSRHALLRFLPSIPADRVVTSAKLRAYASSDSVVSGGISLYSTWGGWTESAVTWDTEPARRSWLGAKVVVPGGWTEWDVTAAVKPGASQVNFTIQTGTLGWRGFEAREATGTNEARLVITTEAAPTSAPSPTASPTPTAPAAGPVRVAAVGDMNGVGNVSTTSPSGKNAASIAAGLADGSLDAFFGLGDFQYETAYCADYVNYWKKVWGGTKSKLYWVSAPNHDWQPGRNADLDDFMNGQCAGDTTKAAINTERGFIANGEPYSRDFGTWHVAFLSSALWRYDTARAGQVTTWLDNDLAAAKAAGKHLAVVYHDPYFTSDTAHHTRAANHKPWIDVMYKHRVRLTLSGSQHNYERSCPVNNADQCVADGMTAFQVSTGGKSLRSFLTSPTYIAKRFSDTHGWLGLTLNPDGSFGWKFTPVVGTSTDTGTRPAP